MTNKSTPLEPAKHFDSPEAIGDYVVKVVAEMLERFDKLDSRVARIETWIETLEAGIREDLVKERAANLKQ